MATCAGPARGAVQLAAREHVAPAMPSSVSTSRAMCASSRAPRRCRCDPSFTSGAPVEATLAFDGRERIPARVQVPQRAPIAPREALPDDAARTSLSSIRASQPRGGSGAGHAPGEASWIAPAAARLGSRGGFQQPLDDVFGAKFGEAAHLDRADLADSRRRRSPAPPRLRPWLERGSMAEKSPSARGVRRPRSPFPPERQRGPPPTRSQSASWARVPVPANRTEPNSRSLFARRATRTSAPASTSSRRRARAVGSPSARDGDSCARLAQPRGWPASGRRRAQESSGRRGHATFRSTRGPAVGACKFAKSRQSRRRVRCGWTSRCHSDITPRLLRRAP